MEMATNPNIEGSSTSSASCTTIGILIWTVGNGKDEKDVKTVSPKCHLILLPNKYRTTISPCFLDTEEDIACTVLDRFKGKVGLSRKSGQQIGSPDSLPC